MSTANEVISNTSFSMLRGKIGDSLLDSILRMGFEQPTEIQAKTLPHLLLGKDLIGAAKTGSGKTLAFLIPAVDLLDKLKFSPRNGTGCIILTPTRELALQIHGVLERLLADLKLTSCLVLGGTNKDREARTLAKGINIVVATPGRLLDHLTTTDKFLITNLKMLVLDEADKLLDMGFMRDIKAIISKIPKQRQTVLFSATIAENIENLANLAMSGERVFVSAIQEQTSSTNAGLTQGYCLCPVEQRLTWLFRMLRKTRAQKVMVFFSSCRSVDLHFELFSKHCRADVLSIHGKHSQPKRRKAFESFVSKSTGVLFCTDVAARGLDIPAVDWIVQYDPPTDPKEYIHRVGRTARGEGGTGHAVLLLRPEEQVFLDFLRHEKVQLDLFSLDKDPLDIDVQQMLEQLVETNGVFKVLAKKAYIAFLRSYRSHPMRHVFNIKNLDFHAAGRAFGFTAPPHVDPVDLTGAKKRGNFSRANQNKQTVPQAKPNDQGQKQNQPAKLQHSQSDTSKAEQQTKRSNQPTRHEPAFHQAQTSVQPSQPVDPEAAKPHKAKRRNRKPRGAKPSTDPSQGCQPTANTNKGVQSSVQPDLILPKARSTLMPRVY